MVFSSHRPPNLRAHVEAFQRFLGASGRRDRWEPHGFGAVAESLEYTTQLYWDYYKLGGGYK